MKTIDTDHLIERIHSHHAQQRQQETQEQTGRPKANRTRSYAIAAAAAILLLVVVTLIWPRTDNTDNLIAKMETPTAEENTIQVVTTKECEAHEQHRLYAHHESEEVQVYCEDYCNPDDVIARLNQIIQTLD